MDIKTRSGSVLNFKSDAAMFTVFEDKRPALLGALSEADKALGGVISRAFEKGEFTGKKDEVIFFHCGAAFPGGPERIIVAGLGKKERFSPDAVMSAAGVSAATARGLNLKEIAVDAMPPEGVSLKDFGSLWTQGALLGLYTFTTFKTPDPHKKDLSKIVLITPDRASEKEALSGVAVGKVIAESVAFARDMINTPANEMTPTVMAERAREVAREFSLKLKVMDVAECKKLGMGAFLGVASGSKQPAKFIVVEYGGGTKKAKPVVIIGKGITFDSGGISIKPVEGMEKMKYDMAGGAAVIAAIRAAAGLKLPVNLVAIVPATENMPDGAALKPGDVVKAMNGKTIEIISTDAEGRLVLSDALCYAKRYKPGLVIDIATLTGACVIALGDLAIGLMGNDAALIDEVRRSGDAVNERLWELPMWDEYLDRMKGDVTDLKNVGGRAAATVTAGKFLQEFVDGFPWAHLDIAGTAWEEKGKPYVPKGATAVGVRLLVEFLRNHRNV
ncbi:MAG: leucyl aminopeptidase [Nitrospirota bacterium]